VATRAQMPKLGSIEMPRCIHAEAKLRLVLMLVLFNGINISVSAQRAVDTQNSKVRPVAHKTISLSPVTVSVRTVVARSERAFFALRRSCPPKLKRERALLVLGKIDEVLAWEQRRESERDTKFVELGRYLCEVRAEHYWRLKKLKSFDEFLVRRFS
jgi:hypothetical protein